MLQTDYLYSKDMIAQCEAARKLLVKENEDIDNLEKSILEFVNDEELISHKISVAKAHFYDYYLLLEELKRANDGDIVAFSTLQSEIEANVYEDLRGDVIIPAQVEAHNNYLSEQAKADQYLNWANNNALLITNMDICLLFTTLSNYHRNRAKGWFDLSIEYKQKMLLYDTIEYKTAALFPGIREDIYARIKIGLSEIKKAYQDGEFNVNLDASWRTNIKEAEIYQRIRSCWISEEPLNLENNIGNPLVNKLIKIGVTQEEVDAIWNACRLIYEEYEIELDPILLLSILGQEGNGSFNTSSSNPAADGQHGYEADFALDLMKANDLMFGKIIGYIVYGNEFKTAVVQNKDLSGVEGEGSFAQYANWCTPIISLSKGNTRCGVYAGHGRWYRGVTNFYESIRGENTMAEYSDYLLDIDDTRVNNLLVDVELRDYDFVPDQNAQNSDGKYNGEYTIVGR